jgi:hypothetical protein
MHEGAEQEEKPWAKWEREQKKEAWAKWSCEHPPRPA